MSPTSMSTRVTFGKISEMIKTKKKKKKKETEELPAHLECVQNKHN